MCLGWPCFTAFQQSEELRFERPPWCSVPVGLEMGGWDRMREEGSREISQLHSDIVVFKARKMSEVKCFSSLKNTRTIVVILLHVAYMLLHLTWHVHFVLMCTHFKVWFRIFDRLNNVKWFNQVKVKTYLPYILNTCVFKSYSLQYIWGIKVKSIFLQTINY